MYLARLMRENLSLVCLTKLVRFKQSKGECKEQESILPKVSLFPAYLATETNLKIEISIAASLYMTLSNKRMTQTLIRLFGFYVHIYPKYVKEKLYSEKQLKDI